MDVKYTYRNHKFFEFNYYFVIILNHYGKKMFNLLIQTIKCDYFVNTLTPSKLLLFISIEKYNYFYLDLNVYFFKVRIQKVISFIIYYDMIFRNKYTFGICVYLTITAKKCRTQLFNCTLFCLQKSVVKSLIIRVENKNF